MSTNVYLTWGERIRSERERLGLTQAEVAERIGVSRATQINYESGKRSPDGDYLFRFGELGADTGYILFGERSTANNLYSLGVAHVLPHVLRKAGIELKSVFSILDLAAENEANAWGTSTMMWGLPPEAPLIPEEKLLSLIDVMFENDELLDQIFFHIAKVLHERDVKLQAAKKADIVLMLYDAFKSRGKVDKKTVEIAVKSAAQ